MKDGILCVCVCRVYLIEGSYPEQLIQLWDSYATSGQSQNDRPGVIINVILSTMDVLYGLEHLIALRLLSLPLSKHRTQEVKFVA